MKKMKVMSIILALLLLVSAVTAFATGPYYGADTAEFEIQGTGATATVTTLTNQAGKSNDDYAYCLSGAAATASKNYIQMRGIKSNSSKLECQFMLKDDSSTIRFNFVIYTDDAQNTTANNDRINISTSGITGYTNSSGTVYTTVNLENHTIEKNKWYTLAIVYAYGSTTNKKIGDLYLNGIKLGTINSYNNYVYSMAYTRPGCGSSTSEIYLDNLYTYSDGFSPEKLTPSYVTSVTGGAVEDDVITVPYGTKVSELSSILTTDDGNGDIVRIYTDSSMTTEADSTASANGTTMVVAATNGADEEMAYSYYTIEEADPDADVLKGGSVDDFIIYGSDDKNSVLELETGVYGKTADDSAYKFTNEDSAAYVHKAASHNNATNSLLEFSFARASDGDNFYLQMPYYDESGNQISGTRMYFNENGIEWGTGRYSLCNTISFEPQKWYTIAIQFPCEGSKTMIVYVNGEEVYNGELLGTSAYGLKYARFYISNGKTFYLDNFRTARELYTPSKDAKAEISVANGIVKDNVLKMLAADENKITIGETDILRMYKSDWSTAANLSEADFVVAAAKNGRNIERTYTYLDKEIASVIVDYSKAIQEDVTSLSTKLMSNEEASTLIVAWYNDKELVDLEVIPAAATDDIYVAENNLTLNNSYSYRIFAWNSLDGLYALTKATDVK